MFHRWVSSGEDGRDSCLVCGVTVEVPEDRWMSGVIRIEDLRSMTPCVEPEGENRHEIEFGGVDEEGFDYGACGHCGVTVNAYTSSEDYSAECIRPE